MKLPEPEMTREELIGYKLGIFITAMAAFILKVVVPTLLWRWFAVPLGAPKLSYLHMLGLLLLLGVFRHRYTGDSEHTTPKKVAENVAVLLTALVTGLVCSYFI
jgi:protein-S-isoprenylcysteine O-methyltransferase Ste14